MKGERRHELEHNQLANWLAQNIEAVKPYMNWILGGVLLLAVAGGWYSLSSRQASARQAEGWDEFYSAMSGEMNPADFEMIADDYPGTALAQWSTTMAGDLWLSKGCSDLFENKSDANMELRSAVDNYRKVLDQGGSSEIRQRATFGLARAMEAQGDLDKAVLQFQKVAADWPDGAYAAAAASRAADLQTDRTKNFYDQFAKFEPRPASASGLPGFGEQIPFDFDSLSSDPIFGPGGILDNDSEDDENKPLPEGSEPSIEPDATDSDAADSDAADSDAADSDAADSDATDANTPDTDATDADESASDDSAEAPPTPE